MLIRRAFYKEKEGVIYELYLKEKLTSRQTFLYKFFEDLTIHVQQRPQNQPFYNKLYTTVNATTFKDKILEIVIDFFQSRNSKILINLVCGQLQRKHKHEVQDNNYVILTSR